MPSNMRSRGERAVDIAITGRYKDLLMGKIKVEDLDDEELARCQLRDKDGKFRGRPPKYIPVEIVQRMRREFFKRGDHLFEDSYVQAVKTLQDIMLDEEVDPAVRMKAAVYIIERVRGKTPDRVVVEATQPWVQAFQRMMVAIDPNAAGIVDIEDAVVVED